MAATMKDIAARTGLGLATISSYFNGGNVREKNRVKIEAAIEELHYEVNEVARGLKTNETKTIGVVIPELNNTFCAEIITGMEDILRMHGYATIVCDCRTDPQLEKEAMDFLLKKRVDGLINMPSDTQGKNLAAFSRSGKPVVLIDRRTGDIPCDCILADTRRASKEAVLQLLQAGHRRIGIVCGPQGVFTAEERLKGYLDAHRDYGLPVDERLVVRGDYTIEAGVQGIKQLVREAPQMTAALVTNYELTMGCVIGLNELGLRVPEDLSVIGFDNLSFARACSPALTIIAQPTAEIAREAAETILMRLTSKSDEQPGQITRTCSCSLIPGRSVSAPSGVKHEP